MEIQQKNNRFLITGKSAYGFEIPPDGGLPVHLYWGEPGIAVEDLPSAAEVQHKRSGTTENMRRSFLNEYPVFFGEQYAECALKLTFASGVRGAEFQFCGFSCEEDVLKLEFREKKENFTLYLLYRSLENGSLIGRQALLRNDTGHTVQVEQYGSAAWQLPERCCRLTQLCGHWAGEWQTERVSIPRCKTVLENRTGLSGPFHAPFFAVDDGNASERQGEVFFGTLLWSGDWSMTVEKDTFQHLSVTGGINPFDNALSLADGEEFLTPLFLGGYTRGGFGEMSRLLHRYQKRELLPEYWRERPRPFLYNTWDALVSNVNEDNVRELMKLAASVNTELFVIDDGWQENLGDWRPHHEKFPRGLAPLAEEAKKLNMLFGVWVELESFELKSELYSAHPEWAMSYPGREPFQRYRAGEDRTSVMLNLGYPEAAEFFYQSLHKLIRENHIDYLKIDNNCYFSSPGNPGIHTRVAHVQNLHRIFERLNKDFPHVLFENCAAGGCRADLAMSRYFARINRSDNQEALDVPRFHEGFTLFHAPFMAGGACHISNSMKLLNHRDMPLDTQAAAGLLGSFACGKALNRCTAEELEKIRSYTEIYRKIRHITVQGEFYRLRSADTPDGAVFLYLLPEKTEAVVFAFGNKLHYGEDAGSFRLQDMDDSKRYQITSLMHRDTQYHPQSGAALNRIGLTVDFKKDRDAEILYIKAEQ